MRSGLPETASRNVNDQDFFAAAQTNLRARLAEALKDISALNTRVRELSAENSELKFKVGKVSNELKDTQAVLGRAVVNSNRQEFTGSLEPPQSLPERFSVQSFRPLATANSSPRRNLTLKRSRSPSLEIIDNTETSASAQKKAKQPAVVKLNTPKQTQGFTSVAYVSVPPLRRPRKSTLATSNRIQPDNRDIQDYLILSTPLKINPPALHLQVPRKFLWKAYGGNEHQFLQYIQEDMNPSGPFKRGLVFPMLEFNPLMPSQPGHPGLLYTPRHEIVSNGPWTLFGKLSPGNPIWDYLGEYESEICGKMSASQFANLPMPVKRGWARSFTGQRGPELCRIVRARVVLRREGLIPLKSRNEEAENIFIQAEVRAILNGKGKDISENDIITAFSKGDEVMEVIRMTCVKYDHVFANDIEAKLPNFEALLAASTQRKAAMLDPRSAAYSTPVAAAKANWQLNTPQSKPRGSAGRSTLDIESEDEKEAGGNHDDSGPPAESHSRQSSSRAAGQKVLKQIGQGLMKDFGIGDSDSDYIEG